MKNIIKEIRKNKIGEYLENIPLSKYYTYRVGIIFFNFLSVFNSKIN